VSKNNENTKEGKKKLLSMALTMLLFECKQLAVHVIPNVPPIIRPCLPAKDDFIELFDPLVV
jgi:hypothetical protein